MAMPRAGRVMMSEVSSPILRRDRLPVLRIHLLAAILLITGGPMAPLSPLAADEGGWHPIELYGDMMGDEDPGYDAFDYRRPAPEAAGSVPSRSAAAAIAEWATIREANGPQGRPLPLAGNWMTERMYGPQRFVEMIEEGHHMFITISDSEFLATYAYVLENQGFLNRRIPAYLEEVRPVLEYARKHRLPIAIRGNNWSDSVLGYELRNEQAGKREYSIEETARPVRGGVKGSDKMVSPFGPVERWAERGTWWTGNPIMRALQEIYPDPPMVVFLNNNEGGHWRERHVRQVLDNPDVDPDRFVARYDRDMSDEDLRGLINDLYDERYAAMFVAARETFVETAWAENSLFVAYNAWPGSIVGLQDEVLVESGQWRRYDGAMPEFYLNDWQIYRGKTDFSSWSPQSEAMAKHRWQRPIFEAAPEYYFASITWDGGRPSNRRSAVNEMAKGMYGDGPVQRWDFDRYEGMIQFGLWANRPRELREFRWPATDANVYDQGAFDALVRAVDRPWNHEILREFWRFGEVVGDPEWEAPHAHRHSSFATLLPTEGHPPRGEWRERNAFPPLRVLAQAFSLGEAPERRWLVMAHAPLGAVADVGVEVPGFGPARLPYVSLTGSFFHLIESDGSLETLIGGGPAEIELTTDRRFVKAGESVALEAAVVFPPEEPFVSFRWTVRGEEVPLGPDLTGPELRLDTPGPHIIRVIGETADGEQVVGETTVYVGDAPHKAVVYELTLDDASSWKGVWDGVPGNEAEPLYYRLIPNPGAAADMVMIGGRLVEDPEKGRVLSFDESYEGLWGDRSVLTCLHREGYPNLTIELEFKATTTEGTQVLYSQGGPGKGFNIYLHDGRLYAGSMTNEREWKGLSNAETGDNGYWLSTDRVRPGQWHRVALVLRDAGKAIQPDKMFLYLDGEEIDRGPGMQIPNHHSAPRIGRNAATSLHTGKNASGGEVPWHLGFFRQMNAAAER